ncbi:MnP-atypical, short manganese peroxidase [Dentipellis sp. KUC8613]|nr:MnP-atypical, short manganese peroxidase [Dentipellis sp. KUC8613]
MQFGYTKVISMLSAFPWLVQGASVKRTPCRSASAVLPVDDQCCVWYEIQDDLQANLFSHSCEQEALEAVRIAFHDAVGRSRKVEVQGAFGGGGADGSILMFADVELAYPENHAVDEIGYALKSYADRHGVGYGDMIQFAAAVALTNCPGAPRLPFLAGRPDAKAPAPQHANPSPSLAAEDILERMGDAGFTPEDTVALMAAHSIGRQRTLDPAVAGMPLDMTPGAFDTQFYLDVLLKGTLYPGPGADGNGNGSHYGAARSPSPAEFRIASDAALARHPRTACAWAAFIGRQDAMMAAFRAAMGKLAVNGQDAAALVDCSGAVPPPQRDAWGLLAVSPLRFPPGTDAQDVEHSCAGQEMEMLLPVVG